jgi:hypothetical protein
MTKAILSAQPTVRSVSETLDDGEKYVRNVLENMSACRRDHGTSKVSVRIGEVVAGKLPHHRIDYVAADGMRRCFGSFDGKSTVREGPAGESAWSAVSMSYDEIRHLLGDIRGYEPPQLPIS